MNPHQKTLDKSCAKVTAASKSSARTCGTDQSGDRRDILRAGEDIMICFSSGTGWYGPASESRRGVARLTGRWKPCPNRSELREGPPMRGIGPGPSKAAGDRLHGLVCALPRRGLPKADVDGGAHIGVERDPIREDLPSVIEITLVGMYAETSPAWSR